MGHDGGPGSQKLRKADRRVVEARLREDTEENVVLVLRWAHEDRTSWWYRHGALGLATLCRAKGWSDRLDEAYRWSKGDGAGPGRAQADPRPILARVARGELEWADRWHEDDDTDQRLHAAVKGVLSGLRGDHWQHREAMQTAMARWEGGA